MAIETEPPSMGTPKDAKTDTWLQALRSLILSAPNNELRNTLDEVISHNTERTEPIAPGEKLMIANVLKAGSETLEDVMLPRADIDMINVDMPLQDIIAFVLDKQHSRYPVYNDSQDDVLGFVHVKELLVYTAKSQASFKLREILRPVLFVAPTMQVLDLLLAMRQDGRHLALVIDEFGGVDGLVTIEDLVERIVGDIRDEYDHEETPEWCDLGDGQYLCNARYEIGDIDIDMHAIFNDEDLSDIDTLGGLVLALAGYMPLKGEVIHHEASNTDFHIVDADPRSIKKIKIQFAKR
ncbi:MAG: hemolysin family protein [Pseudomonadota bacterium]